MSANSATRIIDGDGHIIEDNAAITAHMETPYRDIAQRKGVIFPPLDHLHAGRAVETPPQRDQRAPVGPMGWLDFLDGVAFAPVAGGLNAVYRDRSVTKPLPWRFARGHPAAD